MVHSHIFIFHWDCLFFCAHEILFSRDTKIFFADTGMLLGFLGGGVALLRLGTTGHFMHVLFSPALCSYISLLL